MYHISDCIGTIQLVCHRAVLPAPPTPPPSLYQLSVIQCLGPKDHHKRYLLENKEIALPVLKRHVI